MRGRAFAFILSIPPRFGDSGLKSCYFHAPSVLIPIDRRFSCVACGCGGLGVGVDCGGGDRHVAVARRLQLRKGIVLHGSALVGVGQLLEFVTPVGIFYTWDGIFLILF